MTKEYGYLSSQIKSITKTFEEVISPDPLDQTDDKNQNLIKSYILLCHAGFEKYFEDVCLAIIRNAKEKFDKTGETSTPLLCLSLMMRKEFKNESLEERLRRLYSNYNALIQANHGIKKSNIKEMLEPVSLIYESLSELYLENMETFGKKRGEIAHNSIKSLTVSYNFKLENQKIQDILKDTLNELDCKLETYL